MGINFPNAPTVNQLHPDPAVAGMAQYKWDGTAWVAAAVVPVPVAATSAEYISNSAPTKMLTSGATWGAAAYAAITDGATITLNLSLGLNFAGTIGTGRTMANPTFGKAGQTGLILLSTGTVTTWGSNWKFPNGVKPISSGGTDIISYIVGSDGATMFCTANQAFS